MRWFAGVMLVLVIAVAACDRAENKEAVRHVTVRTLTPTPTALPTPTATPIRAPTPDPRTGVYRQRLTALATQYSEVFNRLTDLSGTPRLEDARWRSEYRSWLQQIKAVNREMRLLEPPSCLQASHVELLKAASLYDQGADELLVGLTSLDSTRIDAGGRLFAEGDESMRTATTLVRQARC